MNSLPLPSPSLRASTLPPCCSTNPRTRDEADTESALRAIERRADLENNLEDPRQMLGCNADTRVFDGEDQFHRGYRNRFFLFRFSASPLPPLFPIAVSSSALISMVRLFALYLHALLIRFDNTCASRRVGVEGFIAWRQRHRKLVSRRFHMRPRGFQRLIEDQLQRCPFLLQFDLALADAAEIQKIVDQAHHLVKLTFGDPARQLEMLGHQIRSLQQLDGVADRRQGISQLVRQGRQKLVLAPVSIFQLLGVFAQRFLGELATGNVARDFDAPTTRPSASFTGEMVSAMFTCEPSFAPGVLK